MNVLIFKHKRCPNDFCQWEDLCLKLSIFLNVYEIKAINADVLLSLIMQKSSLLEIHKYWSLDPP